MNKAAALTAPIIEVKKEVKKVMRRSGMVKILRNVCEV
jgi:hypothetical protein